MEMEMEMARGFLVLVLPMRMVEPYRDRLPGWGLDQERKDRTCMESVLAHLEETQVAVSVELGTYWASVGEILEMRVGDTIWLDPCSGGLLPVRVEGVPKFLAQPGESNGKRAVRITGQLSSASSCGWP